MHLLGMRARAISGRDSLSYTREIDGAQSTDIIQQAQLLDRDLRATWNDRFLIANRWDTEIARSEIYVGSQPSEFAITQDVEINGSVLDRGNRI